MLILLLATWFRQFRKWLFNMAFTLSGGTITQSGTDTNVSLSVNDAFYQSFNGITLSNLITKRND